MNMALTLLPFLKERKWPKVGNNSSVSTKTYGKEDLVLQDKAIDEVLHAIDSKDNKALVLALHALIDMLRNEEETDGSVDSQ